MSLPLPETTGEEWVEATWINPGAAVELEKADLVVQPKEAYRLFRVYRLSDGSLLTNGGWDAAHTRPLRVWPADTTIPPGDGVRVRARAPRWPTPVQMWAVLTWQTDR